MKTIIALSALLSISAHATQPAPTPSTPSSVAVAGSASLSRSSATGGAGGSATGGTGGSVAGSGNGTAQILGSGNSTNTLTSGAAYGGAAGAGGNVDMSGTKFGSDVSISTPKQAPGVFGIASAPAPTTCDGAGISIGGSGSRGGGLLNFGVGERESCLAAQDTQTMRAAGFSVEDVQRRVCAVSTIAKTPTCKRYAQQDADGVRADAILNDRPVAKLELLP